MSPLQPLALKKVGEVSVNVNVSSLAFPSLAVTGTIAAKNEAEQL